MNRIQRVFAVVSLFLLAGLPAIGQTTGNIVGSVSLDGGPLPGVTITVSSQSLQGTRTVISDANGNYNIPALPPGMYKVDFAMDGMQNITRSVKVELAAAAHADATMKLSALAEAITVTAAAPAVLENTEIQSNISANLIESLPTGRTLIATVNLAPGVNSNGPRGNTAISGAMSYDSTYYINGTQVNEVLRGQPLDLFIEDALQETTVLTGGISAEYGRFTGGVVSSISKSGGNEFSGSFRESLINESWSNTTPLNESKGVDKNLPTYEATLGGRIIRDQLWFFLAGRQFERDTQTFLYQSTDSFVQGRKQDRLEGKLTLQATAKHAIVGSYLDLKDKQTNFPFAASWERSALDESRETPQTLTSINYNGILTNNFLASANYAKSDLKFISAGGPAADFANGSNCFDAVNGVFFCAPTFSDALGDGLRETEGYALKGSYYLSTKSTGTHNIVAGYEDYTESILENNSQSGSDFTIYTYDTPDRAADGTLHPIFDTGNALIIYWPILQLSQGNDFNTQSVFINDKWDFNSHWNFNLGARYDKNQGSDQAGASVADDNRVSPRVGVNYDVRGDGRFRLTASYSEYASKVSNGNVGDAASPAGQPSYLYWLYYGPRISGVNSVQALTQMNAWFQSVGGITNTDFLLGGGTGGVSARIRGKLKSPGVTEYSLGAGTQIGNNGFVRVDYQNREWDNFYATFHTLEDGSVFDPLAGVDLDIAFTGNSDNFQRKYDAVLVQGSYRLTNRLNLGGNYTWSTLKGNYEGETGGAGPIAPVDPLSYYPEILAFENGNPNGYLNADQRHKARLWLGYDLPTSRFGNFNISVLERFDSGTPYSVAGVIDTLQVPGSRCTTCPVNPGYENPPTSALYYFSDRGALRWDDITATDLAVNYSLPLGRVQLFVQAEVINVFDESAQVFGNSAVLTSRNSSCIQTTGANTGKRCAAFNPFTETPVEGINYQKHALFGTAGNPTTQLVGGDFQLPLTYRGSFGIKF